MGLINSFLGMPDDRPICQFEFRVMSEDMIEEIKKVIKKLLIRGEKITEDEYSSRSMDYIKDSKNNIILFKTGERTISSKCFEFYYMMELDEDMWKVINRRTFEDTGEIINNVSVVYIPSKISSTSSVGERTARSFAKEAILFYENETHMMGSNMRKSFYQIMMEDDLYRKLIESNNQNKQAIMAPLISKGVKVEAEKVEPFTILLANDDTVNRLFGEIKKKIFDKEKQLNIVFEPKIYAKSKEGVVVARAFCDEDAKSFADEEGSIAMKRIYFLSDGLGIAKIITMEKPFKKEIVIVGIMAAGRIQLGESSIKRNAAMGIKCLAMNNYDKVNVVVHKECSFDIKIENQWL